MSELCDGPWAHSSCFGHNGDSEAIFLDVGYITSTSHWVLERAWYSAHGNFIELPGTGKKYFHTVGNVSLFYPTKKQGFPRSYVARGKHANYASIEQCEEGGVGASDTCDEVDTASRVTVIESRNIGKRSLQLLNCVVSQNPSYQYYGSGRQECLWSSGPFRGWISDSSEPRADLQPGRIRPESWLNFSRRTATTPLQLKTLMVL